MTVRRIVANIDAASIAPVQKFYSDLFGLEIVMDHGWIVTLASEQTAGVQISIATEGGSGTPVPDLSIEVDDIDAVYARAKTLGHDIAYDLANEPWGVRRFFVRDPAGKLLNILSHPE
ncbi:VOC family protein [Roseibium marinum]|uniref:Putative enzyme related to lactoylglutathione lyase n=1 Tax=Roseibium marinum TaxID=281252 RepID=A0A2S3V1R5_9HYPH|nr:VOC family protein [Roseibium marinum]POF33917.1 putative enzyme related to lactoylglutathione lyase [Roseibium marinum]